MSIICNTVEVTGEECLYCGGSVNFFYLTFSINKTKKNQNNIKVMLFNDEIQIIILDIITHYDQSFKF